MNVLLLIAVMASMLFQSIAKKQYNIRTKNTGAFIFNALTTLSAGIFFLCTDSSGFQFDFALIPYILGFAVSYGSAVMFSFLAIRDGAMSLTSLATSYSLIIPTIYGLLFLNESAGVFLFIGLILLLCSLFLVNSKKSDSPITFKWLIYALLAFLGNGLGSTIQTAQQNRFEGQYKSEFMILALVILSIFFFTLSLIKEKADNKACLKSNFLLMILNGAANGFTNLFVMILVSRGMPASIMFPVISGGGIIFTSLVSIFVYKEKLSAKQYIGLLLGTASVVFMNI